MTNVQEDELEEMFVQVAARSSYANGILTLSGVNPATLYFSDRPERVVGHLTTNQFVGQWGDGDDSFAEDPPNAVLSFVPTDGEMPREAVVVLRDPSVSDDSVSYAIDVLDGGVPAEGGACTLFVDPLGMPLSPVSVMGVRRRDRRRMRRRL
jgi:hypothetical protein